MDIATLVGLVGGLTLIVVSISMGSPLTAFINVPGLMIVVGGTLMATLIMQKLNMVFSAFKIAMNAFFDRSVPPESLITQIVNLAQKVRKGGLLVLEQERIKHPFLERAVRMAVDGVDPQEISHTLKIEIDSLIERHERGQKIFRFMGSTSPAMGMIGTLIGLVQMLRTLDDPSSIGPAMAVALLTTFYGAVMAFLIFNPIADKLEERTKEERYNMEIILTGIEGIIKGINHLILQDKLVAYLPSQKRKLSKR